MPELPEVETIKNELAPCVLGRGITGIELNWERIVRQPSSDEFRTRLIGQQITGLSRRGKYLIFHLGSAESLIIHLKMSGSLLVKPADSDPDKYARAVIRLDNGSEIQFRDPRKFGRMYLVKDAETVVGKLGPEALGANFTPAVLTKLLAKRSAPIKALLTDQELIAGIGNMYADEALFAARIHPMRSGASLSKVEIERLHHAIQEVLRAAIVNKGASIENYIRPGGELGTAHFEFNVAHRRGEYCPVCGTPLSRITVRGRGTYFCPKCQPPQTE